MCAYMFLIFNTVLRPILFNYLWKVFQRLLFTKAYKDQIENQIKTFFFLE